MSYPILEYGDIVFHKYASIVLEVDVQVLAWTNDYECAVFDLNDTVHPDATCVWFQTNRMQVQVGLKNTGAKLNTVEKHKLLMDGTWELVVDELTTGKLKLENRPNPFDANASKFPQNILASQISVENFPVESFWISPNIHSGVHLPEGFSLIPHGSHDDSVECKAKMCLVVSTGVIDGRLEDYYLEAHDSGGGADSAFIITKERPKTEWAAKKFVRVGDTYELKDLSNIKE